MLQNRVNEKLQNLKSQSLSTVVEEQLEQMILNGELKPGERINESSLSNLLQISRAPIREACRQLAQYGMIENRVGKGSYVRLIELEEALELYDLRGILDALAAEQAAVRADERGHENLRREVENMRQFADDESSNAYFAANLAFHWTIVDLSGNQSLRETYEVIIKKLSLFRQRTLAQRNRLKVSLSQHEGIFNAICAKDADLAARLARAHVEDAKQVLLEQFNS